MDVDISIDDSLVLGCGYDRSVRIWSASSQKHVVSELRLRLPVHIEH